MGQQDELLFNGLARTAERRLDQFNAQALANTAWAFRRLGIQKPKLMQKFGSAASLLIDQFTTVDLQKFVAAYVWAGGKDESWANAAASPYERKYEFPAVRLNVSLSMQVPLMNLKKGGTYTSVDKSQFRSGMALWDASFVLAEFM